MVLELEDFFRTILAREGFPCLAIIRPESGISQIVCENLPDFFRKVDKHTAICKQNNWNLYFCISTFAQRSYVNGEGKTKIRTQANALQTKALILDVDVEESGEKEGKPAYKTQDEARQGIQNLCQALNIPDPYIVNSGKGLHVYWPLDTAVPAAQWYELASRFKSICANVDNKLVADSSRPSDSASLLRVPDTINVKLNKEKEVYEIREVYIESQSGLDNWSYEDYLIQLERYIKRENINWKSALPRKTKDKNEKKAAKLVDLGDLNPTIPPVSFSKLTKSCNFVKWYWENRTNSEMDEPAWKAVIDLLAYRVVIRFKDGKVLTPEEAAIFISEGYPGFSEKETIDKINASLAAGFEATSRRCDSLSLINPEACRTCKFRPMGIQYPFKSVDMSPPVEKIVVEKEIVVSNIQIDIQQYELPKPPFPFDIGEDGSIYRKIKGEDGKPDNVVKIYDNRLIPIQRIKDDETGNYVIEIELFLPKDGLSRFIINNEDFHDEKTLIKELAKKGASIEKKNRPYIAEYLVKYIKIIQDAQSATENYETFGWKNRESESRKFVLYDTVIRTDGAYSYRNTSRNLKQFGKFASSKGDVDKAVEAIRIYEGVPEMEPFIISLMLSFGAPLLSFLNELGLIYNIIGPGGEGKSSAAFIASSIWGEPTVSHGLTADTPNALMYNIATLQNLPFMYDEMTSIDSKVLSELAYAISNGREKSRLNQDSTRKASRHWQTVMICSSNYSLYGKLGDLKSGNNAHAYRILEFNAPKKNDSLELKMDSIKDTLRSNYGVLGREWIRFIFKNYDRIWESIKLALANIKRQGLTKDSSRERFWNAAQVLVQVACTYTKEMGWHNYNAEDLSAYMKANAPRNQVGDILGDAGSKLNDYLNQNAAGVIRMMDDKLVNIEIEARGANAVSARLEGYKGNIVKGYIPVAAMERWCRQSQTDFTWLRTELTRRGVLLRATKKRLGTGTKFFSLSANSWELDMLHPYLTGVERPIEGENKVVKLVEALR